MTNATSDSSLYIGLYLPDSQKPTTSALIKLRRDGLRESGYFAYGLGYLNNPAAIALNPLHLPLRRESHVLPDRLLRDGGALPLTVKDAMPDAWGRLVLAHELGGRMPSERELLLLTNDDRVGAMVFSETRDMPAPSDLPHHDLGQLAEAAHRLQYDMEIPKPLKRLLQRGGSLGGARPKASFTHDHALWLAKFSAAGDPLDVQILEAASLGLAAQCGIRVPQCFTLPVGHGETAFLSRRFDRYGTNPGNACISCRPAHCSTSLTNRAQAATSTSPRNYAVSAFHRLPTWKNFSVALVFNLLIDNSDDHLKNHGVLYAGNGLYRLSPAFDVVPQLTNLGYQMLSIDGNTQDSHLDLAIQVAPHFDLSTDQGSAIVKDLTKTVIWRMARLRGQPPAFRMPSANALMAAS